MTASQTGLNRKLLSFTPTGNSKQALAEIFSALLNSDVFRLNH
jgi:hypothetical protein